ncbi:hypothetical protein CEXT_662851 [Caerostris extrusa]|uniref:Uncharacterized protein n=1 Tax=Caerostris extrusa TaxID=172846 RepID=A0AAV4PUF6_CAEEX|nr:hypothetical protein CEXT_662851 [Caerostris extrusa]
MTQFAMRYKEEGTPQWESPFAAICRGSSARSAPVVAGRPPSEHLLPQHVDDVRRSRHDPRVAITEWGDAP